MSPSTEKHGSSYNSPYHNKIFSLDKPQYKQIDNEQRIKCSNDQNRVFKDSK